MTAREIIIKTYRKLGVIGIDEFPSAEQYSFALTLLPEVSDEALKILAQKIKDSHGLK